VRLPDPPSPRRRGRLVGGLIAVVLVVVLAVAGWLAWNARQSIADWISAASFRPEPRITAIVEATTMTPAAERVFLATAPTLDATQGFAADCAGVGVAEGAHVLGCHVSTDDGFLIRDRIHLFEVTDERLAGVVEVSAAHELLHAVWSRLGDAERAALTPVLLAAYQELAATDPGLAERMAVYQEVTDAQFANELHSILGTEVRELPAELEAHYAGFFADRAAIVGMHEGYRAVFDELAARVDALQGELEAIRAEVEARTAVYDESLARLDADIVDFNVRAQTPGGFDSQAAFAAARADLVARSDALQAEREAIQAEIARYDELRAQLEALGAQGAALDASLAPPASVG